MKSKAKSSIDRLSVHSPTVEVLFAWVDSVCVFVCVFWDLNAISAAICPRSGRLIDFLLSMWMAM